VWPIVAGILGAIAVAAIVVIVLRVRKRRQ